MASMPAIVEQIAASPAVRSLVHRFSESFRVASGYRKFGLRHEDIIMECDVVQEAINRLPEEELQERNFRFSRAINISAKKATLPAAERTSPADDVEYLTPYIRKVQQEQDDLIEWDKY
ncbi:ubiquinol-cytochrome c reductase complex protein [Thecamonas trahens ATCC 50062]|uniref:Complex III subunit 7 n=1 Tax=Thecamonas trahens ATCC 50062 TaxID=461836 RepID=A0A0L0DBP5_THETB|nr:ubiquinol-cytochrome c reductase complex protein [Thecamonas trahens ATCC 50062]KNC49764.1 ubiquinol-cytochrome c reductase complex protein [Thecamonas trahens ATCC 50062]|eukprot:XP_013757549.1 ubiquinol-cytochrome c reductase complex protein [Thecamonas trahens ATCC 50062]